MTKKVELKTKPTRASVEKFLDGVADEQQRKDARKVLKMMQKATGEKPTMWGPTMIGFGERTYRSPATGREVDFFKIGFSPRKGNTVLYVLDQSKDQASLLAKLGRHKTGKSCLYIKRLSDIDEKILERLIVNALNGTNG
jgi:hypothetical protein